MRPIVALISDFGAQDHYVGAVKGAVLSACREATLVDVCHDLPPHDILAGAFALLAAFRAFPAGTVFLAVVDPDVGSERRALAVEAGGYRFVGPDNGLLGRVLGLHPDARVHEITNGGLFRHEVSPTFHGRDVFGPVAGHLAAGTPLEEVGPEVHDPVLLELAAPERKSEREWECEVVHVDRFGNLVTNLGRAGLDGILAHVDADPTRLVVVIEEQVLPLVRSYYYLPDGEACALLGSSDYLEVAVRKGNACSVLGASRGTPVRVRIVSSGE